MAATRVCGIDLFCGAGGLTYGLQRAGISIVAGVDLDPECEFPFTKNNGSPFVKAEINGLAGGTLAARYPKNSIRLLAGCAPCRPFSPFRRGTDNSSDEEWGLLREFGRLVREIKPELVTMENVPDLASKPVFRSFTRHLCGLGYQVDHKSVYCPPFGIPQHRRRLVLLASSIGRIDIPTGALEPDEYHTVRDAIGSLPEVAAGEQDSRDRLHKARAVTKKNLDRLRASKPGGTWRDWDRSLRSPCHKRKTGSSYQSVYARMNWDEPSPTITTQAYNFGTGRFGHPEQDRSITLREAALLQTFPKQYRFVKPREPVYLSNICRLIGNAVPPKLAFVIGKELVRVARAYRAGRQN